MDTDEILWTGRPSNWHYFGAWVVGIALAVVLVGFLVILWITLDRSRTCYTVTRTKVIVEQGLWSKTSDEIRIADIRSIAMRKRGVLGLTGVGDLEFSSAAAADAAVVFQSVPGVEAVRDLVRRLQTS